MFAFVQTADAQTRISAPEMEKAAKLSLAVGADDQAIDLADALLLRNNKDVTAHLIRSRALRNIGHFADARSAAREGWRHAADDEERYTAALLMAQALSSDDKRTRAQFWLRRARQAAPSEAHAAQAARDYRYVQRRNPWQTHLSFTLAPNSNINNGSARDTSALFYQFFNPFNPDGVEATLGAASKALSGLEIGGDVQSRYRFHQTERTAHDLRMGLSYRTYQLSSQSRDDLDAQDAERIADGSAPLNVSGGDFAYGTLRLGYGYKQLRKDGRGEFSLTADLGQSFYGGSRYNSFVRAGIGQTYYTDQTTKLRFDLNTDLRQAQRGSDTQNLSVSTGLSRQLPNGNGLYLGGSVAVLRSETASLEYDELRLRGGYVLGRPVFGTSIQFGLGTSLREYDTSPHDAAGRRDLELSADITATFKQIDYYGFNPTLSLNASTTNSNIGLYDVNRVGLSIGIASAF
ncbi:surface lipoprotein assembly modifier [uncultured Sulfitobacter sp.]|uniref:surface lipoprotein assembly modifier n=1 Tax=uncultured Sulfitobacter sp. TaxID=191468 RepID=UPI002636FDE3|nr:surface lipoprotein assembly modifier [uncultured Sulfitobacter sp.]